MEQHRSNHGKVQVTCHASESPINSLPNVDITDSEVNSLSNMDEEKLDSEVSIIQNGKSSLFQTTAHLISDELNRDNVDAEYDFDYLQRATLVQYEMRDGKAKADKHYKSSCGTLVSTINSFSIMWYISAMRHREIIYNTRFIRFPCQNFFLNVISSFISFCLVTFSEICLFSLRLE